MATKLVLTCLVAFLLHIVGASEAENRVVNYDFDEYRDRCTAIGVAKKASVDGSTMTTHNNDCQECDFRITHVPARDWPAGSQRPVFDIRAHYPRYISNDANNIHGPDYLASSVDTTIYNWPESTPIGYVDQVPHTYAYTLGTYAIQNEKQVSIGESTCSARFYAKPVSNGGKAMMHMETLTEIALERCDTARCAIKIMGEYAERYGFYGPESGGPVETAQDEAGEALTVSDPDETWMFHVLPDDTQSSAVWVAQRVPDDHITAVANQFVIYEIDLNDEKNFLGSKNMYEVATRAGLWSADSNVPFNFARVYGTDRHLSGFACTRRVWRVFTMLAPSLLSKFSPYTDGLATFGYGENLTQPYPFSIKPDKLVTPQDIMNINRDQYEGTVFDMTKGTDSGPFGDPMRFPPTSILKDPVNGVNKEDYRAGLGFQRAISIWRTAYSTVTQSRKHLPDVLGAVTWVAPYAPHFSTFVPIYANADSVPKSMRSGTQYKLDKGSNWWVHCVTGNYLSRWYSFTISDIRDLQHNQQESLEAGLHEAESRALAEMQRRGLSETTAAAANAAPVEGTGDPNNGIQAAKKIIQDFQDRAASNVLDSWWDFFFEMVGKYRDMYKVVNPHAENFNQAVSYLTYPRWWMEQVGYWGAPGTPAKSEHAPQAIHPINVPSLDSPDAYKAAYPRGFDFTYQWPYNADSCNDSTTSDSSSSQQWVASFGWVALGLVVGVGAMIVKDKMNPRKAYLPIN